MQGMGWECRCRNSVWECKTSGWKCEKCENQGSDAGNQGGNLSIAVEMTQNCNGSDKFKERREVKIRENKYICKNLFSQISSVALLVSFGHILHNVFLFFLLILSR